MQISILRRAVHAAQGAWPTGWTATSWRSRAEPLVDGFTGLKYRDVQRRAAGQEHPDGHRAGLRGAVLRQRLPPDVDAAAGRRSACWRSPRSSSAGSTRRSSSSSRCEPTELVREQAVHPAQHRGDPRRLRPGRRRSSRTTPATGEAERRDPQGGRRHAGRTSGCSTRRSCRRRSASCSRSAASTRFPDALDVDRYAMDGRAARRRRRRARGGPRGRPGGAQLDQRPRGLHPRVRRGRCLRQHVDSRRAARTSSPATSRRSVSWRSTSRASTSARSPRTTRSSVRPRAPSRASSTSRTTPARQRPDATTPTTAPAASPVGIAASTSCCSRRSSRSRTSCCPTWSTPSRKILYDREPRDAGQRWRRG